MSSPFKILEASIQVISNNKVKEAVPFIDSNLWINHLPLTVFLQQVWKGQGEE